MNYTESINKMRTDNSQSIITALKMPVIIHDLTSDGRDSSLSFNEKVIIKDQNGHFFLSVLTRFIACDNVPSFSILKVTFDLSRDNNHEVHRKNFFGSPENLHSCFIDCLKDLLNKNESLQKNKNEVFNND